MHGFVLTFFLLHSDIYYSAMFYITQDIHVCVNYKLNCSYGLLNHFTTELEELGVMYSISLPYTPLSFFVPGSDNNIPHATNLPIFLLCEVGSVRSLLTNDAKGPKQLL